MTSANHPQAAEQGASRPARTEAGRPLAVLIGPPGAGKTTVGVLLAERLGARFLDTDAAVEAVTGKAVSDIFVEDGEPAFRELERAAVATAIAAPASITSHASNPGPADLTAPSGNTALSGNAAPSGNTAPAGDSARVVGLGGGAVLDEGTQALLAGQPVVYLETGFTELAKRVGLDRPRPLLIGINPRAQLKSLLEQRLPVYARLARLTVSTDGREPADIADEIAARLGAAPEPGRPDQPDPTPR